MTFPVVPAGFDIATAIAPYPNFRAWLNAVAAQSDADHSHLNGTIVNADIGPAAWIAPSKIAGTAVVQARAVNADETTLTGGGALTADRTLSVKDAGITAVKLATGSVTPVKLASVYQAKTATYPVTAADSVIDCTTGTFKVTLPDAATVTGREFIVRNSGTGIITIARTSSQTVDGVNADVILAGKGFLEVVSNGASWNVLRGTYGDESIGRRIFTWSPALAGWQMTYGDTGWRKLAPDGAGWAGDGIYIRRLGFVIDIRLNLTIGSVQNALDTIPAGLQNSYGYVQGSAMNYDSGALSILSINGAHLSWKGTLTVGQNIIGSLSYTTTDAWPASLPGAASGSLPAA